MMHVINVKVPVPGNLRHCVSSLVCSFIVVLMPLDSFFMGERYDEELGGFSKCAKSNVKGRKLNFAFKTFLIIHFMPPLVEESF